MKKLKTIQEIIEKRARKRAEDEVAEAHRAFMVLRDSKTFKEQYITVDGKNQTLSNALWWVDGTLIQSVIDELTEKYIPQEAERFVADVERLKDEVDGLYNQTNTY